MVILNQKSHLRQGKIGYDFPWKQHLCTLRGWGRQEYKFGDVQSIEFFFHIPDFF